MGKGYLRNISVVFREMTKIRKLNSHGHGFVKSDLEHKFVIKNKSPDSKADVARINLFIHHCET